METHSEFRPNSFGTLTYFDRVSGEVLLPVAPIWFYDDFLGAGHTVIPTAPAAGSNWCSKLVKTAGTVTVGAVANGANGQIQIAIDATSEKQDAVLYCADQRAYSGAAGLVYETRIQLPVIPTAGTKAVFGMAAAWADGPNNIAEYLRFAVNGSGALLCESQDGTTQLSVASGVTIATTGEWHILRIDASDPTSVRFFVDGQQVASTQVFPFAAAGAAAALQPYASVYKAAGASVGSVALDFVSISSNRG